MKYMKLFEDFNEDFLNLSDKELKKFIRYIINKSSGGYDDRFGMNELYNIVKNRIYEYKKLPNKVRLYRLVQLNNIGDFDKDDIGKHYVLDFKLLTDQYLSDINLISDEDELYIIEIQLPKTWIDFENTITQNILFPDEFEISVSYIVGEKYFIDIKPYKDMVLLEYYDNAEHKSKEYFKTRKYADNQGKKLFKKWYDSLNKDEIEIIEWYRDSGSREIANSLQFINKKYSFDLTEKEVSDRIGILDDILKKSVIENELIVYKGIPAKSSLYDILNDMNINDTYHFKTFISSTIHFQYGLYFSNSNISGKLMRIKIKKGSHAGFVSFDGAEAEVIINKDTNIKLLAIHKFDMFDFNESNSIIDIYDFEII